MQQRKEGLNHNMPYFVFMFVCLLCEGEGGGGGDRDFTLGGSQSTSFGKRCLPFDLFLHSVLTKMNPQSPKNVFHTINCTFKGFFSLKGFTLLIRLYVTPHTCYSSSPVVPLFQPFLNIQLFLPNSVLAKQYLVYLKLRQHLVTFWSWKSTSFCADAPLVQLIIWQRTQVAMIPENYACLFIGKFYFVRPSLVTVI